MSSNVIEATGLARRFGTVQALEGVNLHVPQGSIYGFLGPNGAGKTTTIRILLGLLRPQSGEVRLLGHPIPEERLRALRRVGTLVESPSLYPHLSGYENLELVRRMIDATPTQVQRALSIVGLDSPRDAHRPVRGYSQGMRQRLGIAIALLPVPELLILDEPTNGLDPAGIREMRELIRRMPEQDGVTVFLSSHLLGEIEQLATHIGIIDRGHVIFEGVADELRASYQDAATLVTDRAREAQQLLLASGWASSYNGNGHLTVRVNGQSDVAVLNRRLVESGIPVYGLHIAQPSLEDIFLALTGKPQETAANMLNERTL
ncbi:MAG: ATP-binding cassette domain-containing protein [Nitrososphaerales archaeon]